MVIFTEGAAECAPKNLWLLELYDAGKIEVNSTVCFIVEITRGGLHTLNIMFSFVNRNLIEVLKCIKVSECDWWGMFPLN